MKITRSLAFSVGPLVAVVVAAAPVRAQASGQPEYFDVARPIAIGYVVNAPRELGGASVFVFGRPFAGWGVYADVKTGFESPADEPNFDSELTVAEVEEALGDVRFERRTLWRSLNVGLVRSLTGVFAVYAGAGVSDGGIYQEYFDVEGVRGLHGYYWAKDDIASGVRANLMAGAWLRLTQRLLFQFGGELNPRGFTVGLTYAIADGR